MISYLIRYPEDYLYSYGKAEIDFLCSGGTVTPSFIVILLVARCTTSGLR